MVPEKPYKIGSVIPKRFSSWRGPNLEQKHAVEFIVSSDKKYLLLQMPTGYGKSLVAVAAGLLLGGRVYIIVPDTQLLKQYEESFHIVTIAGRKNYKCTYDERKTAADCPYEYNITKCPVIKEVLDYYGIKSFKDLECEEIPCPYMMARCRAKRATVPVVMTSDYFYYAVVKSGVLPAPDYLIIDEAHLLPQKLRDWYTIRAPIDNILKVKRIIQSSSFQSLVLFSKKGSKLRKTLSSISRKKYDVHYNNLMEFPENVPIIVETISDTIFRVSEAYTLSEKLVEILASLSGVSIDDVTKAYVVGGVAAARLFPEDIRTKAESLFKIMKLLEPFKEMRDIIEKHGDDFYPDGKNYHFIIYRRGNEIELTSVSPGLDFKDFEEKLGLKKIVFMSATMVPSIMVQELKLFSSYDVFQANPLTPPEARSVIFYPYAPLYRDMLDQKIFSREYVNNVIDRVLKSFDKWRGVILVSSKKDIDTIMKYSKYRDRLIEFSGSRKEKEAALEKHAGKRNSVLVSTAWEGVDLKDDLSRFQILYQVPYLYLGDPYVFVRKKLDPKWYVLSALNKIVQGAGRSVRHAGDYSVTFIFDERFDRLLKRYSSFLPKWFVTSVIKVNSVESAIDRGRKILKKFE